jgi:hypothetical protein
MAVIAPIGSNVAVAEAPEPSPVMPTVAVVYPLPPFVIMMSVITPFVTEAVAVAPVPVPLKETVGAIA